MTALMQEFLILLSVYIGKDIPFVKNKACRSLLFLNTQVADYLEFWIFFAYYKDTSWYGGLRPEYCEVFPPNFLPRHLERPILSQLHPSEKA